MATRGWDSTCDYSHNVTFYYNRVNKTISEEWTTVDCVVIALGLSVCFIVILSNMMVMLAFFINRRFHFPIYYLLGNLAMADLFAGLAYVNLILNTGPWTSRLSKRQWFVRGALIDMSCTASVANLLAVAVERHQTIIAMQLHSQMSVKRVMLLIFCIWAVAIIMGLIPSLFWNCECDLDDCSFIAPLYSRRFLVFWALLNLLTFFIMVAVYTRIFLYVRSRSRRAAEHTSELWHSKTLDSLMKTTSLVLGAFVICWTPGLMTLLLDGLMGKDSHAVKYEKYCLLIAVCNSLVNPIIYSLRDEHLRRTFKYILCLCRKGSVQQGETSPQFDSPHTEVNTVMKSEHKTAKDTLQLMQRQASEKPLC